MKHFGKALFSAGILACSAFAHSAPVTTWSVTASATWVAYSPAAVTQVSGTKLSWGNGSESSDSSLTITNPAPNQALNTYNGIGPMDTLNTITLTHDNNPINGTTLVTATLRSHLELTGDALGALTLVLPDFDYQIGFAETNNAPPCVVASPTACNDIFVLLTGAEALSQIISYEGENYKITANPIGLGPLSNAACTAAGASSGCYGFTTVENQSNPLQVELSITAVPEPGSLALVGLALAGAGFIGRRRRTHS